MPIDVRDSEEESLKGGEQQRLVERKRSPEELNRDEKAIRDHRNVALNEFRQSKLFGSFNDEYRLLRTQIEKDDTRYDNTYAAYNSYLADLRKAGREGTPLSKIKKPSLALDDNKHISMIKKFNTYDNYVFGKIIKWTYPVLFIAEMAGRLWDREEFKKVQSLIKSTEKQRTRVMSSLDHEIQREQKVIKARDAKDSDLVAESAAREKDAKLAQQIRENLGTK